MDWDYTFYRMDMMTEEEFRKKTMKHMEQGLENLCPITRQSDRVKELEDVLKVAEGALNDWTDGDKVEQALEQIRKVLK